MASFVYQRAVGKMISGTLDIDTDDIRAILIKTAEPTTSDDEFVTAVLAGAADEITDGSYSRQVLANKSVTFDDANNRALFDADDSNFGSIVGGETVIGALIYKHVTNDTDSPIIAFVDIPDKVVDGNPFIVVWNTGGIVRFNMTSAP